MRKLREWIVRLGGLFHKERKERELDEEIESHLQFHIEDNLRLGMTPGEARREAMTKLGGVESMKEAYRDQRGLPWLETLWQDVRYGARMLRKNPGFTAVAAMTLAIGIGANTAIFTVINAALLRSLPVVNPRELVVIAERSASGQPNYAFSHPFYKQLCDGGRGLSGLFAAGGVGRKDRLRIGSAGETEVEFVRAQAVSGNFFSTLGAPALIGRTLTPEDDREGAAEAVAVISHDFWTRRFGGDASVIGKPIAFNDTPFTIVGVTQPGFFGFQPGENPELWWPLQMTPRIDRDPGGARLKEGQSWLRLMGRLAPGVERTAAEAELGVIFQHYRDAFASPRAAKWSDEQKQKFFATNLELQSGHAGWAGSRDAMRQPLFILMTIVALTLLIACANVASLLLARAAARVREFSIRGALGAGRIRIARQLLTECLLLAGLGGAAGFLFAHWGVRLLHAVAQLRSDPISLSLAPDSRALVFTAAVSLLTGLIFGLAPAFRSSRIDLGTAMKALGGGVAQARLHQALIVGQVALSLMLLIGAGLFIRTLRNLKGVEIGFNREDLILFNVNFTEQPDAARWPAVYKQLLERLETLPGARSASLFGEGYLSGNNWTEAVTAEGYTPNPGENLDCTGARIGPKFFETLGTPLLAGREFGPRDERLAGGPNPGAPAVAVINQTMARRYFGDANPIGRRLFFTHRPDMKFEIVGLVPDAKYRSLRETAPPMFYLPYFHEPRNNWANFAVSAIGDPRPAMGSVPGLLREVDRTLRLSDLRTMDEVVNRTLSRERLVGQLGGFFSVLALGLACLGLYGVLSFSVTQCTREIGIRMALGARRLDVFAMAIGNGLKLVLVGSILGILGALVVTRPLSSLLYGVEPADPATFITVLLLIFTAALIASWLPARRATKVQPTVALRYE